MGWGGRGADEAWAKGDCGWMKMMRRWRCWTTDGEDGFVRLQCLRRLRRHHRRGHRVGMRQ